MTEQALTEATFIPIPKLTPEESANPGQFMYNVEIFEDGSLMNSFSVYIDTVIEGYKYILTIDGDTYTFIHTRLNEYESDDGQVRLVVTAEGFIWNRKKRALKQKYSLCQRKVNNFDTNFFHIDKMMNEP